MRRNRRSRSVGRARGPALVTVLLAVCGALLWAGAPLAAGKGSHVTPADRAATRALLEARLAYVRAQVASAPATAAALGALDSALENECSGVMIGAPHETLGGLFGRENGHGPKPTARQEGEANRHERQFSALQSELDAAQTATELAQTREAALAYARVARALRWTDPVLTAFTHLAAESLEAALGRPVPPVCSDMKAWVASDYRTLSPGSKAIERSEEEELAQLFKGLRRLVETKGNLGSIGRFEGPGAKRLAHTIASLETSEEKQARATARAAEEVEVKLGLKTQAETEELERPRKGSVEIGHGRTLARTRFKVYVEPPQAEPGPFGETQCEHPISVYPVSVGQGSEGIVRLAIGSSSEGCLSGAQPAVECEGKALTIELRTVAAARRVRLTLSDGRRVSSPVAHVPGKLGGPAGVYYQAVPGSAGAPRRLEELGARGRVLRTIALAHTPRCPPRPVEEPKRRTRALATGALPGGATFTIDGTGTTYEKHTSFALRVELETFASFAGFSESSGSSRAPRRFTPQLETGCQPSEFAIVYGLLREPGDVVLARTTTGLVPLRKVKIPKALHAGGVLVYAALPSVPQEVVVQTRTGRKVSATNLETKARDSREVCEGEAEG